MNSDDSWLAFLPADAEERKLLFAAAAERPPRGAVERGWDAFCATAGLAAATGTTLAAAASPSPIAGAVGSSAGASAATAAGGTTGQGALVTTVTAASGKAGLGLAILPVATKATIVGFSLGIGVLGTAQVVQHVTQNDAVPIASTAPRPTPQSKAGLPRAHLDAPTPTEILQAAETERGSPAIAAPTASGVKSALNHTVNGAPTAREPSLAAQAEELAQIKRLLDSGAHGEAVDRLRESIAIQALSLLAEDRDALFVEALKRSSNWAEAKRMAESFCERYPNSPHRERFLGLLESE